MERNPVLDAAVGQAVAEKAQLGPKARKTLAGMYVAGVMLGGVAELSRRFRAYRDGEEEE